MDKKVKALKVKEANSLLKAILMALIINDGLDDVETIEDNLDSSDDDGDSQASQDSLLNTQFQREINPVSPPLKITEHKELIFYLNLLH